MSRMRLFVICGGEDEPQGEAAGPTKEEVRALEQELRKEQDLRKRVEERLLDPTYVEFLTTRMGGGERPAGKPEPKPEEPDFDAMTGKQLVQHILGQVQQIVTRGVQTVQGETAHDRSVRVINETAARHPDFWEYRETLEQFAQVYPNLHPEHAYLLAKQLPKPRAAPAPKVELVAEPVAVGGEAPTNRNRPAGIPAATNGPAAFAKAWKLHVGPKDSL